MARRTAIRPVGARVPGVNDAAAIRSWARANGIEVPDRGRIPTPIRDSYAAAHNS
ncbi:histone-like nucleoid-structuring protein Lsr2 [Williamsia sp. CHRR-6]|uniref:Lsr2 family DNA-binding protein n=1 Tax=Williamsia sp. CHRR-6 TaxID=2835871 RepID=UPI001BD9B6A6|nr:Lsr2 family protein [Williamsia sp. CHRR-6]